MGKKATRPVYRNRVDYSHLLKELQKNTSAGSLEDREKEACEVPEASGKPEEKKQPELSLFRQRILSNEQIKYIYSEREALFHDKSCREARLIPDDELRYSQEYRKDKKQCPECACKAYVRCGAKDLENYETYRKLFEKMQIQEKLIRHIYVDCGMKTKASVNVLTVWDREDTWKIVSLDTGGRVQLLHNNYHLSPDGERSFDSGYHVQNSVSQSTNAAYAFKIIETYSFDEHKAAKARQNTYEALHKKPPQALPYEAAQNGRLQEPPYEAEQDAGLQTVPYEAAQDGRTQAYPSEKPQRKYVQNKNLQSHDLRQGNAAGAKAAYGRKSGIAKIRRFWKIWKRRFFNRKDRWPGFSGKSRPENVYAVEITDFHIVLEHGLPSDGMVCVYIWIDKSGEQRWRCGKYDAARRRFEAQYGDRQFAVNERRVVAWKELTDTV